MSRQPSSDDKQTSASNSDRTEEFLGVLPASASDPQLCNDAGPVDLRYVDGRGSSRIADLLDRKVESIYRLLTRTHGVLRECMDNKSSQVSQ